MMIKKLILLCKREKSSPKIDLSFIVKRVTISIPLPLTHTATKHPFNMLVQLQVIALVACLIHVFYKVVIENPNGFLQYYLHLPSVPFQVLVQDYNDL